ncbi:MAG TPA: FAD-binding oxidoreductase [Gaiellales bacterium]|nr:FAD-binding oxidoreductase [Gaiellales bacterium]
MADVVVIGGGILGATAALHLAEAGAGDVVLVEREPALGTQTTAAGAGFVGYWAGELEAELAEYGMRFYTSLADRAGTDAGVRRVGLLFPALSEPGVEMLRQEYERELGFAPGVAMIDPAEVVRMAPILSANAVFGALLQPDGHRVDTVRVMGVLAGEVERAGVEVRTGVAAKEAIVLGGRVAGVRTSAGEIAAGAVVNAAGAAARSIGARNGVEIAAVPLLESRFTTEPLPEVAPDLPMMLFFERDLLYLREQAGGLLVGAIEHTIGPRSRVDLASPPRTDDLSDHAALEHEQLARGLANVIPALATAPVRERASGLPTWTPDGRHILGIAPEVEGYVVLAGCNECGVTHGPGLARIAAELVTAGRTDVDISAYRVDRFADAGADAIQAAAESQYLMRHPPEHGIAAAPFGIELP